MNSCNPQGMPTTVMHRRLPKIRYTRHTARPPPKKNQRRSKSRERKPKEEEVCVVVVVVVDDDKRGCASVTGWTNTPVTTCTGSSGAEGCFIWEE